MRIMENVKKVMAYQFIKNEIKMVSVDILDNFFLLNTSTLCLFERISLMFSKRY